ncbi:MAG: hypothetical protein FWD86_01590, partial [Firmicutes bacterium]|nr:hypothetical protein [Bacillota bacterium]
MNIIFLPLFAISSLMATTAIINNLTPLNFTPEFLNNEFTGWLFLLFFPLLVAVVTVNTSSAYRWYKIKKRKLEWALTMKEQISQTKYEKVSIDYYFGIIDEATKKNTPSSRKQRGKYWQDYIAWKTRKYNEKWDNFEKEGLGYFGSYYKDFSSEQMQRFNDVKKRL